MRAVRVRSRHFNGGQPSGLGMSLLRSGGGEAYARDKNTSIRVCAKNAGGGGGGGGGYLRDTTVCTCVTLVFFFS